MEEFNFIRIGGRVYWNDPAIMDYPEEERESQRKTIWTIFQINDDGEGVDADTIVCVTSEYGSEAEVYAHELTPAYCDLTDEQRKCFMNLDKAFVECEKAGMILLMDADCNIYAIDGSDVNEILWPEESCEEDQDTIAIKWHERKDYIRADISHAAFYGDECMWARLESRVNDLKENELGE